MDYINLRTARKIINMFVDNVFSVDYTNDEDFAADNGPILGTTSEMGRGSRLLNATKFCIFFPPDGEETYRKAVIDTIDACWESRNILFNTKKLNISNFAEAQLYILLHEIGHVYHYNGLSDAKAKKFASAARSFEGYTEGITKECEERADLFAFENFYKVKELILDEKGA